MRKFVTSTYQRIITLNLVSQHYSWHQSLQDHGYSANPIPVDTLESPPKDK
ncbi:hypothetical protein [Vibrio ulleungensis]|uniref:Uncharacterized protein n=1 Tax=Vibrio ulleungensis TaxID=2807619 RepID=A0ABS2HGR0_9VIBR|nr:hypothetical protein [Vibrio ulleungensis]MBM7035282.1 hypothetical protein [Vibrio ulleungensis]